MVLVWCEAEDQGSFCPQRVKNNGRGVVCLFEAKLFLGGAGAERGGHGTVLNCQANFSF